MTFNPAVRLGASAYWLGLHSGGTSMVGRYGARHVDNALQYNIGINAFEDGASDPFGQTNLDDKQLSIYATGTSP